jgi:uncharacterized protein
MAPTNLLRDKGRSPASKTTRSAQARRERREVLIRVADLIVRARLHDTPTADRIWATLPIYATANTWGSAVHFETRAETGREAGAKWNVDAGEIAFWVEEDRIIIGFGPTPLSRPGEIRLPCPCNIWATALDDVTPLASVRPGSAIAVLVAES